MRRSAFPDTFRLAFLLVGALASPAVQGQVEKVMPVDEAYQDPSLLLFRLRMVEAVSARDAEFVIRHLDASIMNSFGSEGGVAEFEEMWGPSNADSELWSVLATVLGGGGTYYGSDEAAPGDPTASFEAPYWSSTFPSSRFNAFDYGVIVGAGVRVRAQPSVSAPVLARLSHDLVRVLDPFPSIHQPDAGIPDGWVEIELADGPIGYVAERYVGMAVGRRAVFLKQDGAWTITALIAGD